MVTWENEPAYINITHNFSEKNAPEHGNFL